MPDAFATAITKPTPRAPRGHKARRQHVDIAPGNHLLIAWGACLGALAIVICFSVSVASAYRDRGLLMHAAASLLSVWAIHESTRPQGALACAAALAALTAAGVQLHQMVVHAAALRTPRKWLLLACAASAVLAAAAPWTGAWALPCGALGLALAGSMVVRRAWKQCLPWIGTASAGYVAFLGACALVTWQAGSGQPPHVLAVAGLLAFWSAALYMASVWRHRLLNDTRLRLEARKTVDPLTGLATPMVLQERLRAARSFARRFGNPSVLLLIHIENLAQIAQEFGLDTAEAALVEAAGRIRSTVEDSAVAARLARQRVAVLAEGHSPAQAVESLAGRLLVAGLSQPLVAAPAEFLRFRIVLAMIPTDDLGLGTILQRLNQRMDAELAQASSRRVVALAD